MKLRRMVVLLLLCLVGSLAAQTFRGGIQGTITDPTGAAIAGAQVTVTHVDTRFSRTVVSDPQGNYTATELPLGAYTVAASFPGFATKQVGGVTVETSSNKRVDLQLSPGSVKETVQVTSDVPMVETTGNTMGGTIEAKQIAEIPVNGRDFTKLLEMVPGTASDPVGSTESAGSYGLFAINGNRGRSNNYLLDGTDMNDGYRNLPAINQAGVWGSPSTILPTDALAEVPVTASPEAEFGRSSGATVNLVTKSGGNQIHGSLFEYFRNGALGARNYFNSVDPTTGLTLPKNSFHNNQFGGSLGGPLVKDKTFWFVSYEGQRERGGLPQTGEVPTQSYIDNWKKSNTINPVINTLLNQQKPWGTLPTLADTSIDYAPVLFTTPFSNNSDNLIVKMDQHLKIFSSSDLLTGRYFFAQGDQSFPLGMLNTGSSAPGYNTYTPTHVNIVSLSFTSAPKSNLVFEIRGGYNRFYQGFLPQDNAFNPNSIGLNTLPPGYTSSDLGMPSIRVYDSAGGSLSTIGSTSSDARARIDTNYQLFGNVSLSKGTHNYKWGYEWRRTFINSYINSGHRGSLTFNSLDDFLAGTIDGGSSAAGFSRRYSYQNADGAYAQDSWRLTKRLTMNYGVRWDYYGVVGEKYHQFSLFNATTDSIQQVGVPGGPSNLYPKDWLNFSPRLSFAWDPTGKGKIVVRAGYGIYYDGPSQDFFVGNQPWNTLPAQAGPAFNYIGFANTVAPSIVSGQPIFSNYSPSSAFTVSQKLVTPRYQSYNLNVESQLMRNVALQVGYIGSQGRHLFRFRDINQVDPSTGASPYPNFVYINQVETTASSSYNSMQVTLKMKDWHGLNSTLNYTWAHSIDTASDGLDFVPNAAQPDNSYAPQNERADSNFDVRQRLQWFWNYNLPKTASMKWLTNGWAMDGILNFATGQPFTLNYIYEGDYNGSGEWFGRPDIIGNPYAGVTGKGLLNLAAFAAPCSVDANGNCIAGTQHFGNAGRNQFRAANYFDADFSLNKTSRLTEKLTMQLRADIFNVFNHPNMTNPLLPGFGVDMYQNGQKIVNGRLTGSGILTPAATPDVGSGNPYLGGGGPRTIQLSARFAF
jgi:hypothetical protein